jgi:thymidylate synthase ThyX
MFTEEEKKILAPYVTSTEDNIFAIKGLEGIVGAAYARYSRAKGGFRETLLKEFIKEGVVDPKHADELIARILVAYGDDSVGELEGAHVSFEKISMIAAKEIEDHRIGGSPIEQSTRYVFYDQKDDSDNWLYYRGEEILKARYAKQYVETMDFIFETYASLVEPMKNYFEKLKPFNEAEYDINDDGIKEKWSDLADEKLQKAFKTTYNFDLRSKACDTLRALLPLGTLTNVGMFANGRFYQTLISNLLTHKMPEFKNIANQTTKALNDIMPQYIRRAKEDEYWRQHEKDIFRLAKQYFPETKPEIPKNLPDYELQSRGEEYIAQKLKDKEANTENIKNLLQETSDIDEIALMLYPFTLVSLKVIRQKVSNLSSTQREEIVKAYVNDRKNRRHRPGRALESGYPYVFDTVINFGTYKDLQRHRMNSQQRQMFTTKIGFYVPEELKAAGLEQKIVECVKKSDELFDLIAKTDPLTAQYAVLHGHYIRWTIAFNDREAMHLLELRSTPQGHPNYRVAAQQMHKLIADRSKWRADMMNFVDYNDYYWSRADSEAKQRVKEAELDKKFGKQT